VALGAIAVLLDDYNEIAVDDDQLQERLRRLRVLDTAVLGGSTLTGSPA